MARAEHDRDHVLARPQQARHIVGRVEHCLAVVRERGLEDAVRCRAAVDCYVLIREAGGVEAGADDPLRHAEGLAEHRGRPDLAALALVVLFQGGRPARREPADGTAEFVSRANLRVVRHALGLGERPPALGPGNPLTLPIAGGQEASLEPRRLRPSVGCVGDDAHRPEIPGVRTEGRARVEAGRAGRFHLTRVPHIGGARMQTIGARCDEHLQRELPDVARARQPPGESRRRIVDAERRDCGIGFERSRRDGSPRSRLPVPGTWNRRRTTRRCTDEQRRRRESAQEPAVVSIPAHSSGSAAVPPLRRAHPHSPSNVGQCFRWSSMKRRASASASSRDSRR